MARTIANRSKDNTSLASTSNVSTPNSSTTVPTTATTTITNPASLAEQCAAYEFTQPLSALSPSTASTSSAACGQIHYAGFHLGQINSYNGIPLFSEEGKQWIYTKTGDPKTHQRLSAINARQRSIQPGAAFTLCQTSPEELCSLPDRSIVEVCADLFHQSAFRLVFPVIDRVLFQHTIELAYEPSEGPPPPEHVSAIGCVNSFLAMMSVFHGQTSLLPPLDCDAFAMKAHRLLPSITGHTSLHTLQSVFMLVRHPFLPLWNHLLRGA